LGDALVAIRGGLRSATGRIGGTSNMTIYNGYRKPLSDLHVAESAIDRTAERESARGVATRTPIHLRRAKPCLLLLAPTARWIAALPEVVRPEALAKKFARIANQIHATWNDPPECRKYFATLFSDNRGARQGFPVDVMRDIEGLRAYHNESYPLAEGNVWTRALSHVVERE
jgi:hypothetical protein